MHEYRVSQTPEQQNIRLELALKVATTCRLFETEEEAEAKNNLQGIYPSIPNNIRSQHDSIAIRTASAAFLSGTHEDNRRA